MATDKTELRGLAPIELVQALDALAHADLMNRTDYVNKVLDAHVKEVCHKQIVLSRMLRGNPYISDASGMVG
jgi:hypothetical protein